MKQSKSFYRILAAVLLALAFGLLALVFGVFLLGCSSGVTKTGSGKTTESYKAFTRADAFNLRQVITADSTVSRTIMWQSGAEEKDAFVEYRVKNDESAAIQTQKEHINDKFADNGKTTYVHTVTLKNLRPGTEYEYRLGYAGRRSQWYRLNTAQAHNSYTALIFPDSQSAKYKAWEDVAMPAFRRNRDTQFFIAMGDLVDNGEHAYQWNEWFTRIEPMITRIPAAPVLGNHETYTMDWKVRRPQAYLHYFQLPEGVPESYKNQFYSFDYGDVHYVVLNTQMREMGEFYPNLLQDQLAWFKADMEKSKNKWNVVLMHKDVLRYGFLTRKTPREEGFSEEGKVFMPLFEKYKVDVVLTAHLHTYRNRGHIYGFKRDTKGPLYILTGVAGDVRYPNLWKRHSLDVAIAPQPETNNYMVLEASADKLRFSCYLPDGTKIDEAEVKK
ncbi:MAG: metallophosphoesterase family protein [Acidaminococcaceae bacterium]|nr:metallophosphoesterase family protein [Acidaminococcaceae bacterium]